MPSAAKIVFHLSAHNPFYKGGGPTREQQFSVTHKLNPEFIQLLSKPKQNKQHELKGPASNVSHLNRSPLSLSLFSLREAGSPRSSSLSCCLVSFSGGLSGMKPMEMELTQCLVFLSVKPSSVKTWPRCAPQLALWVSVRSPSGSGRRLTASGISSSKLGHPQLASNLFSEW
jgi:hypothetical protein